MRNRQIVLLLAFISANICLFAQEKSDAGLLGHVINAVTGEHVPYINIYIEGTTIGSSTDESGHFHISNCPLGEQVVVVRGIGYKLLKQTVTFERRKTVELDFRIQPDAIALGQVVVTATQHATSRMESPTAVSVIDNKQLEAHNAVNLGEGMRGQTGVCVGNTCQNCGTNEVRINGLAGTYTQVLIDSRPVNSSLTCVYLLEQLPAAMIEQIEVLRGGGSALYGSNAIAGVVNVITREPIKNSASFTNTTRLVGGTDIDWSNQFNASAMSDNRRAGLFIYGHNRSRQPHDIDGDGFSEIGLLKSRMIGLNGFFRTGDYSKFNIQYHNINDYRRGGDHFDLPVNQAHVSEGGEHDIHSGQLKWDWLSADGLSHASAFASMQYVDRQSYYGEREDDEPFGNSYGFTTDLTSNEGLLYSRHFKRLLFMPSELTAGLEHTADILNDRTLSTGDTMHQNVNIISAYIQNEWKEQKWTVLAGVRIDNHSMLNSLATSPRINVRYAPAEHLVLRAGYSSGFRAPQVYDEDLHVGAVNGELFKIANATGLKPERSHSLNISADLCFHAGSMEGDIMVEAFHTRINNVFVNELLFDDTTAGLLFYERRNEDGAIVSGINAEIRLKPQEKWYLQIGCTLQQSLYTGKGQEWSEGLFEQRMERSPNVYGYLNSTYEPCDRLRLMVNGIFTGPMLVYHGVESHDSKHSHSLVVQQVTTPSFLDITAKVTYSIPFGRSTTLEISAGIQNILNSFQRDFDSGPQRDASYIYGPLLPRTFFTSIRLEL